MRVGRDIGAAFVATGDDNPLGSSLRSISERDMVSCFHVYRDAARYSRCSCKTRARRVNQAGASAGLNGLQLRKLSDCHLVNQAERGLLLDLASVERNLSNSK